GAGNDTVRVKTLDGGTTIATGDGDDTVTVRDDTGLLDSLAALLTLSGGAGNDHVVLDDAAETDANVATIAPTTVNGLDMHTGAPATFTQTLTVNATGGTYTLTFLKSDGTTLTTAPIAFNATAAAIQAAISAKLNPFTSIFDPYTDNVRVNQYGNVL